MRYNNQILEMFEPHSPLEQAALDLHTIDGEAASRSLGVQYTYTPQGVMLLESELYFAPGEQITCRKHERFMQVAAHRHDFLEMTYVYRGTFRQTIADETITLPEGSLILLDTNVVHSIPPMDEECIAINILLSKNYFTDTLLYRFSQSNEIAQFVVSALFGTRLHGSYIRFPSEESEKIRGLVEETVLELERKDLGMNEYVTSLMVILFTELARLMRRSGAQTYIENETLVLEVLDYLDCHCADITLTQAAEKFYFHPNALNRMLKRHTGRNFTQIITELRLGRAASLLLNSNLTIAQVALEAGFGNTNHFYHCFQRKYGCTPKLYRQENHAGREYKLIQ